MSPILAPDALQAVWRLLLNGNPYWVAYPNDDQLSIGRVAKASGNDYRNYAGLPYDFTPKLVDEFQLGFGFWSRSKRGQYRWVAHDIEDGAHGRPTTAEDALADATRAYEAYKAVARARGDSVLTMLEQSSSPGNYHVWTIFKHGIDRGEHDAFIEAVESLVGNLQCLDKTTARSKRGLGDQLRAPGSWKKGVASKVIAYECQDLELLVSLANECRPSPVDNPQARIKEVIDGQLRALSYGNKKRKRPAAPTGKTSAKSYGQKGARPASRAPRPAIGPLVQAMIRRYPITGPGQRSDMTARVILCLYNVQKVAESEVLEVADAWLEHYDPNFDASLEDAKLKARECLQQTIRRCDAGIIAPPQSELDHWALVRQHERLLSALVFPMQSVIPPGAAREASLAAGEATRRPGEALLVYRREATVILYME